MNKEQMETYLAMSREMYAVTRGDSTLAQLDKTIEPLINGIREIGKSDLQDVDKAMIGLMIEYTLSTAINMQ